VVDSDIVRGTGLVVVRGDGSWTASAAGPFAPDDRLVVLDGAVLGPAGAGKARRQ
jgi:membrane protein implicated in regulation of membrane protease activity